MELLEKIKAEIVNPVIYFLLALAAVYFVYGVFMFVSNSDDETARAEGKKHMIWGVVGIAIMLSVKGIIATIQATIS